MKRAIILISLCSMLVSTNLFAQEEKEEKGKEKGFKKENLFTGGSITASFFSGGTILGASPIFGYQLAPWVDAGLVFNYTYQGRRDYIYQNDKIRQHVFGPGVFARIYPARFLFLQGQFEHNFTNVKYMYAGYTQKRNTDANSFLVGAGIAEGREKGSNTFYYISLLFDVLKNKNSPYVDNVYDNNTGGYIRTDVVPIVRAGINIALFQGKNNYNDDERKGNGGKRVRNY